MFRSRGTCEMGWGRMAEDEKLILGRGRRYTAPLILHYKKCGKLWLVLLRRFQPPQFMKFVIISYAAK